MGRGEGRGEKVQDSRFNFWGMGYGRAGVDEAYGGLAMWRGV